MSAYIVFIAIFLCVSCDIRASDKRSNNKRKSLAIVKKQDSTVTLFNPLYQDSGKQAPITGVAHVYSVNQNFVKKSDFYEYRKSRPNMIQRITYSNQGKIATYTWEENPLYEN